MSALRPNIECAIRHAIRAAGCRKMIEVDPASEKAWRHVATSEEMKMKLACARASRDQEGA